MNNAAIIILIFLLFSIILILFIKRKKLLKILREKNTNLNNNNSDNNFHFLPFTGKILENKVALVTGAGKGIGRAVAKCLADQGAKVLINARTKGDLESLSTEIKKNNGICHTFVGDVTNPMIVRSMFSELKEIFGPADICVNSAGIAKFGFVQDFSTEDFTKTMNLNVNAVYTCIQEAVKQMKENGDKGKIITIGSVASRWSERGGDGSYTASKFAVYGMIESIARQLHGSGSKIAVSIVCPGVVNTPLTNPDKKPQPDWLKPENIAASVLHVATAPPSVNIFDLTVFGMKDKPW